MFSLSWACPGVSSAKWRHPYLVKEEEAWPRAELVDETEDIVLDHVRSDQAIKINTRLAPELRSQIVEVI